MSVDNSLDVDRLVAVYEQAKAREDAERGRRLRVIRRLSARGQRQREIAERLGMTQSAVSQHLKHIPDRGSPLYPSFALLRHREQLLTLSANFGFSNLAVFGSVARHEDGVDSDVDLLVSADEDHTYLDIARFKLAAEELLGTDVDVLTYDSLQPLVDDDILTEAQLL